MADDAVEVLGGPGLIRRGLRSGPARLHETPPRKTLARNVWASRYSMRHDRATVTVVRQLLPAARKMSVVTV